MDAKRVPFGQPAAAGEMPHYLERADPKRGPVVQRALAAITGRCLECKGTGTREMQTGPSWADYVVEDCPFCGHHRDLHDDGACPPVPFPTTVQPRPAA